MRTASRVLASKNAAANTPQVAYFVFDSDFAVATSSADLSFI